MIGRSVNDKNTFLLFKCLVKVNNVSSGRDNVDDCMGLKVSNTWR